ncbi:gamma-glutamyltransferase [Chloroflexi bacterium]|nr:gamma-glutamyltransferase [Chloroflexota bacterium]
MDKGIVSCPQPIAGEVGIKILENGGNAFDSALASAFCQWILDPFMCGLGGMGIAQIFDNKTQKLISINFAGTAGSKCTENMWANDKVTRSEVSNLFQFSDFRSEIGYTSVMTPTVLAAFHEIYTKYCSMPWSELLQPAINLAKSGLIVNSNLDQYFQTGYAGSDKEQNPLQPNTYQRITASTGSKNKYTKPDGSVYTLGERIDMSDYASTLSLISEKGAREFYEGELSKIIVDDINNNGGFVTSDDLKNYKPDFENPLRINYLDYEITSPPPPNTGMSVLQMFKLIEPFQDKISTHGSYEYLNVLANSMSIAHQDRLDYNADPKFVDIPVYEKILNDSYLNKKINNINNNVIPTSGNTENGSTTHINVVDTKGNWVGITHTLGWASGVVTPGLGFMYNNGMNLADPRPGNPNSIAPGKARGSNMVPTMVLKNNKPIKICGAPGGAVIVSAVFQSLLNSINFNMTATESVSAPRIHTESGKIFLESRFRTDYKDQLIKDGYDVVQQPFPLNPMMARAQLITYDESTNTYDGGSDPRGGGVVYKI